MSSEQLLFLTSSFFRTVTSSQQLFFQSSYFFRVKPLPSSHFLRRGSLQGSYFSERLPFWWRDGLDKKHLKKIYFLEASTSAQHQLFLKSYFLGTANFSEKQYFTLPTFSGELLFRVAIFSKDLTFLSSYISRRATFLQHTFSEETLFSQLHFLSTATLPIYQLVTK